MKFIKKNVPCQSLKFQWKNIDNWWIWKNYILGVYQIPNSKIQISSFFVSCPLKSWGRIDGNQFLWLLWFPAEKNPAQTYFRPGGMYKYLSSHFCNFKRNYLNVDCNLIKHQNCAQEPQNYLEKKLKIIKGWKSCSSE